MNKIPPLDPRLTNVHNMKTSNVVNPLSNKTKVMTPGIKRQLSPSSMQKEIYGSPNTPIVIRTPNGGTRIQRRIPVQTNIQPDITKSV
jgi:hypothetical protein